MFNNDWRIEIKDASHSFDRHLYVYREVQGKPGVEVLYGDGSIKTFETTFNVEIPPTMILTTDVFRGLLEYFHNHTQPPEGKYDKGKLDATERHLSDLRQMLKLK